MRKIAGIKYIGDDPLEDLGKITWVSLILLSLSFINLLFFYKLNFIFLSKVFFISFLIFSGIFCFVMIIFICWGLIYFIKNTKEFIKDRFEIVWKDKK